jgi:hypothetical protein
MPRSKQTNGTQLHSLVVHYVRSKPLSTTIGELLADPLIGALVRSLTVAQLAGGQIRVPRSARKAGTAKSEPASKAGRGRKANTRTAGGRGDYDGRVLSAIKAAGAPVNAETLLPKVGGAPAQLRAATKRLLSGKKIKRTGKARGTRYAAA